MLIENINISFMKIALKEAGKALKNNDVPVGCVIIKNNKIISKSYNQIEKKGNPLLHAELIAIQKAVKKLGYKHLLDCTMFVTLEPCSMCAGAIVLSRIPYLMIGTEDIKTGGCGSLLNIANNNGLNHRCDITFGIMQNECSDVLKSFFKNIRDMKKIGN